MSTHSDLQTSETEDEYTREISHNTYRLDNQPVEPPFPMPHMFHARPLVPLSPTQSIPRPLLMPPCFPPKSLPFILPPPPHILPIVEHSKMPLMSEQLTLPQSVPEIRTTNTLVEPPKQPFMPPFDPNNLARFPPPMVPQSEPQIMPPELQEPPKHSFDHKHMPHFPIPPFVPIISQAEVPKDTHLEPPDRHNLPLFPPHFDPKNIPLFPPPMVPNMKPLEPLKEPQFVPLESQDSQKFQIPIDTQNRPIFSPPINPLETQKEAQNQPIFMPHFDPNNILRFPPPHLPTISQNEPIKSETQNMPLFSPTNIPHLLPQLSPDRQQTFSGTETQIERPHFEPPEPQFRPPMPHFQPPESEQPKGKHFEIQEPNPLLEPRFMPPELRETHFISNDPRGNINIPIHPSEHFQPLFPRNVSQPNFPQFPPPNLKQDKPIETEIFNISPQSEPKQFPPNIQSEPIQFPPNFQPEPNQFPPNIQLEPKQFPPNFQPEPNQFPPNIQPEPNQFPPNFQPEPNQFPPNIQPEPNQFPPNFQPEPKQFPPNIQLEPNQFPPNFQPEPKQFPPNIQPEPNQFPPNIQPEPNQFPPNFQPEPNQFPPNIQPEPNQFPPNFQPEPKQFPPNIQLEPNQFPPNFQTESKQFPPNFQPEPKQFPPNFQPEPKQFTPNFQPEPKQFPPNIKPEPNQPPSVSQTVPTEMWRPINSENIRFPNPPLFHPPRTQFPPSISSDEQMAEDNMEPSEPQTPEPSEPQVLQPIVSQTDIESSPQTFPHYQSGEMEFNPDHDIPGPHYRSMPQQHRPPFNRPPFQRPYPPPREQYYPPYPLRHPMGPHPHGPRFRPVWTEHLTMDGRVYHHNHETMQSFWEPPEYEEEQIEPPFLHHFNPEMQVKPQSEIEMDNPENEPLEDTIQHPAITKPVNSTPVPGSEWCVVWTNDDKVFFFNAVINKSVWQIPNEIKEHPIARKLMERNPDLPVESIGMGTEIETETKRVKLMEPSVELDKDSSGNNSDENTGENVEIVLQQSTNVKLPKKPKIVKNEFTISEEDAKNIRSLKPLESRISEYKEMLLQRGVSAFSTWEKEQPKVAFDPRYILLTAKERKPIFEQFSLERIHEEKREKNIKLKLRKDSFFSLLSDMKVGPKTSFHEFTLKSSKDPRFKEIEKIKEREKLFLEFQANLKKKTKTQTKPSTTEIPTATFRNYEDRNSKRNRVEASIREREREVSESRRNQKQVIEDQRFLHKRDEARIKYKSILTEMVRDSKTNFKTFEKEIKSQPNYNEIIYTLSNDERLNYFEHHIDHLQNKKRTQFHACIDDCHEIDLSTPFKKARKLIKNDPRFESISSSDSKRETEYTRHLQNKSKLACDDFTQLLRETKLITYKTKSNIESNSKCLQEIEYILVKDRRYLNLDCIQDERQNILLGYINELSDKGAPPPPTATSPNRTRVK